METLRIFMLSLIMVSFNFQVLIFQFYAKTLFSLWGFIFPCLGADCLEYVNVQKMVKYGFL